MNLTTPLMDRLLLCLMTCGVLGASGGCATGAQSTAGGRDLVAGANASAKLSSALQQAAEHWSKRRNRDELQKAINQWERAAGMSQSAANQATRAEIYEHLSRAYFFLADAHMRLDAKAWLGASRHDLSDDQRALRRDMIAAFEKGMRAARRAVDIRAPTFAGQIDRGESWKDHVDDADPSAIPAMYWYVANLGNWALLEGVATALARRPDIEATLTFICAEHESFYHGACHRYLGVVWSGFPYETDQAKAREHFQKAVELAPDYLATKVWMARDYAVLADDPQLYDKLLEDVLDAPTSDLGAIAVENKWAKRKARRLQRLKQLRFRDSSESTQSQSNTP